VANYGSILFSASATGDDFIGSVSTTGAWPDILNVTSGTVTGTAMTLDVAPQGANPVFLAGAAGVNLVTPSPMSMGQQFTVRITLSNTGQSDITSLTPTVAVTSSSWATVANITYVLVSPTPWANVVPGDLVVYDMVLTVSTNGGIVNGPDTLMLNIGANFTDTKYGGFVNRVVVTRVDLPVGVQPTTAVPGKVPVNEFFLSANFFTPASQSLNLYFSIKKNSRVRIKVYNVAAELVRSLFDGDAATSTTAILYSGNTDLRLIWDGKADDGQLVSSGTYLISIEAPDADFRTIRKVNVIR
jgi:hypothetical protein